MRTAILRDKFTGAPGQSQSDGQKAVALLLVNAVALAWLLATAEAMTARGLNAVIGLG